MEKGSYPSEVGRLASPQGFSRTLPAFLQPPGVSKHQSSEPTIYLSQSTFERSTAPQRLVSKMDLHRAVLRAHHHPLRQPRVSPCSRPPPPFQTLWSKQRQRSKVGAGRSCALHARLSKPAGKATEMCRRWPLWTQGPAISWRGGVLLLHSGASLAQHLPASDSALSGALPRAAREPAKGSIRILRLQSANLRPNLTYINH